MIFETSVSSWLSERDGSVTLWDPNYVAKSGNFSLDGMCSIIQNNSGNAHQYLQS